MSPRATLTLVFTTFGAAVGALAGSMPSVMRNAGIDPETFGLGLTLSTMMTVAAMSVGGQIARSFSNRTVLLGVFPIFAFSIFGYLTAQRPVWFFIALPAMGVCFGLIDLFMNAEAVALEHDLRRPVFMAFHGGVSAGVGLMAVASSVMSVEVGTWLVGAVMAVLFGVSWLGVYRAIPARPLARGKSSRMATLPNKLPLALLGIAAGLIIAAETAAILWSAKLLDDLAPSLASIAGLGAAFYGLCNAAVRFPGDRMRTLLGDIPLMIGSLTISIIGFVSLGLSENYVLSVAAFAAMGLGLALLIPSIFAVSANLVPENRAGALSFVSLLTSVPRILAPLVFGFVASGYGMSFAFGLVAVGLGGALMLIVVFAVRR
jgi:hypothetical protein